MAAKRAEYQERRSKLTNDEIRSQQAADLLEKKGDYQAAYRARLRSNRRLAEAHVELGLWCDRNGLKPEETAHFTLAVHLDPYRDSSWKHLGYVKRNGRWTSRDQAADDERDEREQKKADRYWEPLLKKWTDWLGDKRHREEALEPACDRCRPARGTVDFEALPHRPSRGRPAPPRPSLDQDR